MPTKPVLPITELDFFQAKNQLKEFLRNDPSGRFRDIDFEGSNMSVLLDVLAYNTYQNNFYTNMAISEMFLDSAQLENSVVSHAKELNYLPRSAKSAKAVVNVTIQDPSNANSSITIPEGTRFTTNQGGDRFNFFTNETYVARRVGGSFIAENVEIFEGELIEEGFIVTGDRKSIRLINNNIDIASIKVFENFDEPLDRIEYTFRNDIFGVGPDDPVFYIEPSFDGTYEILFGNNRFGREPAQNVQITVLYRVASGTAANGACRFTGTIRRSTADRDTLTNTVTTISNAVGGAEKESLEDIKFFAPRSIQVQERAVTERDYEILLKQRFNEIQDISKKRTLYSDFFKDLTINPISADLALRTNEESVKESLKNLILTDRGERLMQPNIGSDVRASLFENATPVTLKILEERVRDVINNFEPRVSIIDIDVTSLYDDNRVQVTIYFYVKNREDPLSVDVFIDRVR
jgi:phage baseplate assembly protein W